MLSWRLANQISNAITEFYTMIKWEMFQHSRLVQHSKICQDNSPPINRIKNKPHMIIWIDVGGKKNHSWQNIAPSHVEFLFNLRTEGDFLMLKKYIYRRSAANIKLNDGKIDSLSHQMGNRTMFSHHSYVSSC